MNELLIEPHYLGSLEYYCLVLQSESVVLEVNDRFQKQTYRNRSYLLGANGVLPLIVPVSYSNQTITKDVTIDHLQRWKKDHWGAFYSAYGKAPFFEYFSDSFSEVWEKKQKYLVDLCVDFLSLTMRLLQKDVHISLSKEFIDNHDFDYRNTVIPKKSFSHRKIYRPKPYPQLFSNNFNPNLSIIDLLLCEGPNAPEIIVASFFKH